MAPNLTEKIIKSTKLDKKKTSPLIKLMFSNLTFQNFMIKFPKIFEKITK